MPIRRNPPGPVGGIGRGPNPPGPVGGIGRGPNPPGPVGGIGRGPNPPDLLAASAAVRTLPDLSAALVLDAAINPGCCASAEVAFLMRAAPVAKVGLPALVTGSRRCSFLRHELTCLKHNGTASNPLMEPRICHWPVR